MKDKFIKNTKKRLRQRGYKLTQPRLAILEYLVEKAKHQDVQGIYTSIQKKHPGIGMATVYRTVDLFMEIGVLRTLTFKNNSPRYEIAWPDDHHHHLTCTGCGQMIEFSSCSFQQITAEIEKATRFTIQEHTLEAYGLCSQCIPIQTNNSQENS
ncbi:MAG TPA: Fur family transcriptional regulator [Candidatus Limnocylindrales bacterium]|nr:Fur family transcriptional regulator [Candidatus Limnocylindrales bacterium]